MKSVKRQLIIEITRYSLIWTSSRHEYQQSLKNIDLKIPISNFILSRMCFRKWVTALMDFETTPYAEIIFVLLQEKKTSSKQ